MTARKKTRRSPSRPKQVSRLPRLSVCVGVFVAASLIAAVAMICVLIELFGASCVVPC